MEGQVLASSGCARRRVRAAQQEASEGRAVGMSTLWQESFCLGNWSGIGCFIFLRMNKEFIHDSVACRREAITSPRP